MFNRKSEKETFLAVVSITEILKVKSQKRARSKDTPIPYIISAVHNGHKVIHVTNYLFLYCMRFPVSVSAFATLWELRVFLSGIILAMHMLLLRETHLICLRLLKHH